VKSKSPFIPLFERVRNGWLLLAGGVVLFVLCSFFAWRILLWSRTGLVLTDRRLIYHTGVFSRRSSEIVLSKINDVLTTQLVLGRVFGYGDLFVESLKEGSRRAFFNMPSPGRLETDILGAAHSAGREDGPQGTRALADEVVRGIAASRPTVEMSAIPPERPPIYSEIVDQIERLNLMRERGTISEDDFRRAKERLLDRLGEEKDGT